MKGVDISHYQNGLTIQQIKDSGNEFAIIKLTEGRGLVDSSALNFYREAYELGFPVGCYCYSHATTPEQVWLEAAFLLETLNGFPMPCGVFLDVEEPKQLELSHDALLSMLCSWCGAIARAGYIPGIYASEKTLWAKVSPDELPSGTLVWVAKWSSNQPNTPCDLWQSSDNGRVAGYRGPVDTDEARSDRFMALATSWHRDTSGDTGQPGEIGVELSREERLVQSSNAVVSTIQIAMSYVGYWGYADGQKSPEFFAAARQMLTDLSKG